MKRYQLIFGLLCFCLLSACKKDKNEPYFEWGVGVNQLRVYAIDDVTYVIKPDNSLWARGGIFTAEVGTKDKGYKMIEQNVKKVEGNCCSLYIQKTDNSVWGSDRYYVQDLADVKDNKPLEKIADGAMDISAGNYFVAILKTDGTVWGFGQNGHGEFGIGSRTYDKLPLTKIASNVSQIATGFSNIYLLKTDSTLWSAGDNLYGKLGYVTTGNQLTFKKVADHIKLVRASGNNVMMINNKDEAWSFGGNANGVQGIGTRSQDPTYPHKVGEQVANVYPNNFCSFFLKTNGTLWASGSNSRGQMGIATPKESFHFIQVADEVKGMTVEGGSGHSIALKAGRFVGAGNNWYKQLSNEAVEYIAVWTDFIMP